MVGIAVATMVFSTAAMKVAAMQAARMRLRRPLTTAGVSDMTPVLLRKPGEIDSKRSALRFM